MTSLPKWLATRPTKAWNLGRSCVAKPCKGVEWKHTQNRVEAVTTQTQRGNHTRFIWMLCGVLRTIWGCVSSTILLPYPSIWIIMLNGMFSLLFWNHQSPIKVNWMQRSSCIVGAEHTECQSKSPKSAGVCVFLCLLLRGLWNWRTSDCHLLGVLGERKWTLRIWLQKRSLWRW